MLPDNTSATSIFLIMKSTFFFAIWTSTLSYSFASVRVNEVADKGTGVVCNGEDWIELYSPSSNDPVNLTGYILHDDKGPDDEEAFVFPPTIIGPDEYILMCVKENVATSPSFGIGGDDTITLRSPNGTIISTTGQLSELGSSSVTYAWNNDIGGYNYTSTPTPAAENVITYVRTPTEVLEAQNALGISFFNMDNKGHPVADGFDAIVDFRMTMDADAFSEMWDNQSYEMYSAFISAAVTSYDNPNDVLYNVSNPGRIRPRGQSTLYLSTCFGMTAIPFLIDLTSSDPTQTLYGVEKLYLRNNMGDNSYLREWATHRMLARFGLPHLRTRTVRFYINDKYMGLYTMMEAVDQKYVFHRSFPNFDVENYALYKVKTQSLGCGDYSETQLAEARSRIDNESAPPYFFERGDHRPKVEVVGNPIIDYENAEQIYLKCYTGFIEMIFNREFDDVCLAYLREGEDCGKMLVDQGLVDRDLGQKQWDDVMSQFINDNLADNKCDSGCANSNLASQVDTDNFLKNIAMMAVMVNLDSPLGIGNNYYLAQTGKNIGWNLVQYDHNSILSASMGAMCGDESCSKNLLTWSIMRPTCESFEKNQLVGPLLSDPDLHKTYVGYVKEFVSDVVANTSFLDEIQNHALALANDVKDDPFFGVPYEIQTSRNSSDWNATFFGMPIDPFLPSLVARTEEVQKQLQALDDGTFPRGPDEIEADEFCVDWRLTEPDYVCPMNCKYEGCHDPELHIPSRCDKNTKSCYTGEADEKCRDVELFGRYEDMEGNSFCAFDWTTPIKVTSCPDPNTIDVCPMNCMYEGCHNPEWFVPSGCDPDTKSCFHGDVDEKCKGVENLGQYEGMPSDHVCLDWGGTPVKLTSCPDPASTTSGGVTVKLWTTAFIVLVSLFAL